MGLGLGIGWLGPVAFAPDGSYVGVNPNSQVDVGQTITYTFYAEREGQHVVGVRLVLRDHGSGARLDRQPVEVDDVEDRDAHETAPISVVWSATGSAAWSPP